MDLWCRTFFTKFPNQSEPSIGRSFCSLPISPGKKIPVKDGTVGGDSTWVDTLYIDDLNFAVVSEVPSS